MTVKVHERSRLSARVGRLRVLVRAIEEDDEAMVAEVVALSRSRRAFAPLAFTVGAFAMLLRGLKLLLSNWRLTAIQILPAMWIWLAMYDLKAHVLHGKSFDVIKGPVLIPIILAIVALTAAAFFLNAIFGFAITISQRPRVRAGYVAARAHLKPILLSGCILGALLAFATTISPRWGRPWFTLILGVVVGAMMILYVAVPARLIGAKPVLSRRDKVASGALHATLSVCVCTPPYLLGRLGLLMLGSSALVIPGIILFAFGATLQAGTTGAVRAIKMSVALTGGQHPAASPRPEPSLRGHDSPQPEP